MNAEKQSVFWAIFSAVTRAVLWTVITFLLGLLPMGIDWVIANWTGQPAASLEKWLLNGLLVGLVLSLIGSVMLDSAFSRTEKAFESRAYRTLVTVLPAILCVGAGITYTIVTVSPNQLQLQPALTFYKWMLFATLTYCVIAKYAHFYNAPTSVPK